MFESNNNNSGRSWSCYSPSCDAKQDAAASAEGGGGEAKEENRRGSGSPSLFLCS